MPITGIASYVPTMRDFRLHWGAVNAQLGAPGLALPGNYTLAQFTADEDAINLAITSVTTTATAARTDAAQLQIAKDALRARAMQFRLALELNLSNTRFAGRAPHTPEPGSIETRFMTPFDTISELWAEINAATGLDPFTPPLLLPNAYDKSTFDQKRAEVRVLFAQAATAERDSTARRNDRNALLPPMRARMRQYRTACQLMLPKGSPLLQSLPRLSPLPGTMPTPVVVSGAWDNPILKARLTWPASTASNLDKLQVRACTGPNYKTINEEIVGDLAADATHYETDWGLTAPGAIASFKVYVMTTTGNENGGKAVKVVRPAT